MQYGISADVDEALGIEQGDIDAIFATDSDAFASRYGLAALRRLVMRWWRNDQDRRYLASLDRHAFQDLCIDPDLLQRETVKYFWQA